MSAPFDLFVLTLAYTGLRFGEVAGLRRRFVLSSERRLVVAASLSEAAGVLSMEEPKSHQHRAVTMPGFLADRLQEHMDREPSWSGPDHLVFVRRHGFRYGIPTSSIVCGRQL